MGERVRAEVELQELAGQIRHHEAAYRAGLPETTDGAFDDLVDRYRALADSLGIDASERIDMQPGQDHTAGFETVEHRVPMLSLEKLSPNRRDSAGEPMSLADQLSAWFRRRRKELEVEELPTIVEPKVDGISVSLL